MTHDANEVSQMTINLRPVLSRMRRRAFEAFKADRYSRPALHEIDRKLEQYLGFRGGFFVEAGANDGFTQSNTYYFEKILGWSGVLVEAIPELYQRCVKARKQAQVYQCALVAEALEDDTVTMEYANLMSLVKGAQKSADADEAHLHHATTVQPDVRRYQVEVPARTLTQILDHARVDHIDLLSLDVEGYELQALQGLDLRRYRPSYLLVEANFRSEIDAHLDAFGYQAIDELSHHDVLYAIR